MANEAKMDAAYALQGLVAGGGAGNLPDKHVLCSLHGIIAMTPDGACTVCTSEVAAGNLIPCPEHGLVPPTPDRKCPSCDALGIDMAARTAAMEKAEAEIAAATDSFAEIDVASAGSEPMKAPRTEGVRRRRD